MISYELLDSGNDDDTWNIVVAVSYKNSLGYEGIASDFEKIRKAHSVILIDGKGLADLGKIVQSRKLYRTH
jgi:hypothetical protein